MGTDYKGGNSARGSYGGTGKSFLVNGIRKLLKSKYIDGKTIGANKFPYDKVTEKTRLVFLDDMNFNQDFRDFYNKVTGDFEANHKGGKIFYIPFERSPKMAATTNYVPDFEESSLVRRLLFYQNSDYYHAKTPKNDYKFSRKISDDFGGRDIMTAESPTEEWNADYNFLFNYFQNIQKKYGKDKPRRTEIRVFDNIDATNVAVANEKFYINRAEGFIGTSLKKDEYVFDCSDLDDIITFRKDGTMQVTKVEAKTFIGKDILHVAVWKKNDKRTVYNMVYREGKDGPYYMKRFSVTGVIRNNEYKLASDVKGSEVLYFSANPNGEAEIISVLLKPNARIRKNRIDIDFSDLAIKGRDSKGNLVTKYAVKKIELKEEGISTLAPRKIWFDESVRRLNVEGRGVLLGSFKGDDKILTINTKGEAKLISFDLTNRFDDDYLILEKWHPEQAVSCIYYDGEKDIYFIKRFLLENTANIQNFMPSEHPKSFIEFVGTSDGCTAEIIFAKDKNGKEKEPETIDIDDFISIKGIKAMGNQFVKEKIKSINITIPEPKEEEEEEPVQQEEMDIPEDGVIGDLFN